MTEHIKGRPRGRSPGAHLLDEAARLLSGVGFSTNRGHHGVGDWVLVTIDPAWNADKRTLSVRISCSARAHQDVDWTGLPVYIWEPVDGNVVNVVFLNKFGEANVDCVPPGRYGVAVGAEWKRCPDPIPLQRVGPWIREDWTADEQVQVSLGRTDAGDYSVAAEAVAGATFSAGTEVFYCLVKPKTGQVSRCGRVAIGERQSSTGPPRALAAAGDDQEILVFSIVPPAEQAGEPHGNHA